MIGSIFSTPSGRLYEMLTGKKAFAGEGISEILAAVIKSEPDWNALPTETPREVHVLL